MGAQAGNSANDSQGRSQNVSRPPGSKPPVLIICADPVVRRQVQQQLSGHSCQFVDTAAEALQLLGGVPHEVVVVDWQDASDELQEIVEALCSSGENTAVVVLTQPGAEGPRVCGKEAAGLVSQSVDQLDLGRALNIVAGQQRVVSRAGSALARALEALQSQEPERAFALVKGVVEALEARDPYTAGHSTRVARISEIIGREIGLAEDEISELSLAAVLHDVGKLGVSRNILNKRGPLSEDEWRQIRLHPIVGANMVDILEGPAHVLRPIREHHERPDGNGYPDGLTDGEIHPFARIIAVADALDSMSSARPYRGPLSPERICDEMQRLRGQQWAEEVVDVVLDKLCLDGGRALLLPPRRDEHVPPTDCEPG